MRVGLRLLLVYLAPALGEKQRVFQNHLETAQHFFLAAARVRLQLSGAAGDHGGGELGTEREARVSPRTPRFQPVLPSLPVAPSASGPSPTRPHLSRVAVALTQERHRGLLGPGDQRAPKSRAEDGELPGTNFLKRFCANVVA